MSKAFTREEDAGQEAGLPDRAISPHPNLVTAEGLAQIEAAIVKRAEEQGRAREEGDVEAAADAARDLRDRSARRASARLVEPKPGSQETEAALQADCRAGGGPKMSFVAQELSQPLAFRPVCKTAAPHGFQNSLGGVLFVAGVDEAGMSRGWSGPQHAWTIAPFARRRPTFGTWSRRTRAGLAATCE